MSALSRESDWIAASFPHSLEAEVCALRENLGVLHSSPDDIGELRVEGELLKIPARVYGDEPDPLWMASFDCRRRVMVHCLYSRHCDGRIRERHLVQILQSSDSWVVPFVIQILSEYVLEIVQIIADQADCLTGVAYADFVVQNPQFMQRIGARIVSYWGCYYRTEFPQLRDYPAFLVLDSIGAWPIKGKRKTT